MSRKDRKQIKPRLLGGKKKNTDLRCLLVKELLRGKGAEPDEKQKKNTGGGGGGGGGWGGGGGGGGGVGGGGGGGGLSLGFRFGCVDLRPLLTRFWG